MPEIYDEQYEQFSLSLKFIDNVIETIDMKQEVTLEQNYPNPVVANTSIKINSSLDSNAKLMFISIDGKILNTKLINLSKGVNTVVVNSNELHTNSTVIFYNLLIEDEIIDSKKMILKR